MGDDRRPDQCLSLRVRPGALEGTPNREQEPVTIAQMNSLLTGCWRRRPTALRQRPRPRPLGVGQPPPDLWKGHATGETQEAISLKQFLDAAYALLVEEYQRLGIDLLSLPSEKVAVTRLRARPKESLRPRVAAQNEQSMAALQGMLAGVQGAPKTPRRR